jgi:hypothetical protein
MIRPGSDRFAILCVALLAPVLAGACGGLAARSDTPTPCSSGVWLSIVLPAAVGTMTQPTVSVCRNSECYTSAFPALPLATGGWSQAMSTTAYITGTLWRNPDNSITLDIQWDVVDASQLVDGDHYLVTIADGTGAATSVLDSLATYVRSGSDVIDSGLSCLQATIKAPSP